MISLSTFVVSAFVAFALSLAAGKIITDKKKGKHSCGGNCQNCPCSGGHKKK